MSRMYEPEFIELAYQLNKKISELQDLLLLNYIDEFLELDAQEEDKKRLAAESPPAD